MPLKAEEGLTGLAQQRPAVLLSEDERIGPYPLFSTLELVDNPPSPNGGTPGGTFDPLSLDLEGRCVMLDLGLFVLVNVYCPNETNADRLPYKLNFLRVLEARVRHLTSEGREVVVVGDVNVVHRPKDHGEGSLASKQETFWNHPVRACVRGRPGSTPSHEGRAGRHTDIPAFALLTECTLTLG